MKKSSREIHSSLSLLHQRQDTRGDKRQKTNPMESTKLKRALRDPTPAHRMKKQWLDGDFRVEDDPVKKREEQNVEEISGHLKM